MRKKKEGKPPLPPLCEAVKFARGMYGDSQPRFARRIGCAPQTVSNFETGRAEPSDGRILQSLVKITDNEMFNAPPNEAEVDEIGESYFGGPVMNLARVDVARLFREAYQDYERKQTDRVIGELESTPQTTFRSMREWRLVCAARLVAVCFPEQVAAMEKAAGAAITIIDEVLSTADEKRIDYARFEREIFALAEQRTLLELKKGRKKQ